MRGKLIITAALGIVMLAAAGSIAYAVIPDASGVVHTCFSRSTGTWRPIDVPSQQCRSGETQLDLYSKGGADNLFLTKTGKAADSDKLDGLDSTAFLGANAKAADSDKLDGLDSTAFLGANAKAADSDKLDGLDSTAFMTNGDAAGGDLTGTYPDPTIGDGKVTTGKLADGSVTSAKFDANAKAPSAASSDAVGGENVITRTGFRNFGPGETADFTTTCPDDRLAVKGAITSSDGVTVNSTSYGRSSFTVNVTATDVFGAHDVQTRLTCFGGA